MWTIKKAENCRVCTSKNLQKVLSFGPTPLANAFLKEEQLDEPESFYPLDTYFCKNCSFLQLGHVVNPKKLFKNYLYASSTSPVFINHFKEFASRFASKFSFKKDSFIVDIGSNDGILLLPFKDLGYKTLGIEPARTVAKLARQKNIDTLVAYFSTDIAKKVVNKRGKANLVTATNVFAHIDDLNEVINGVKILMDEEGTFVIEAPYIIDFLENRYFDLVYHEHLSYWSVGTLKKLFERFDMKIFHVEKVSVHGGSIRVYVANKKAHQKIEESINNFLQLEKANKLSSLKTYVEFGETIQTNKIALLVLLNKIKSAGKSIAAYGAPAKGNTLLNFFSIGTEILDYVVDDSPLKQGLFTPGKHIPVVSAKTMTTQLPDYLFILAWNFAEPIIKKNEIFKKHGGKFIIPVPKPKVI
jgi:SAM-dependent methyltransferase